LRVLMFVAVQISGFRQGLENFLHPTIRNAADLQITASKALSAQLLWQILDHS
jgi:hypothetical protein